MLKVENTDVYGWEAAIRELYNGKGVRWVYPNSYKGILLHQVETSTTDTEI